LSHIDNVHIYGYSICMRTTLILREDLLKKAMELSDVKEKTALVHLGLQALIEKKSREKLIALGGSEKKMKSIRRRRST